MLVEFVFLSVTVECCLTCSKTHYVPPVYSLVQPYEWLVGSQYKPMEVTKGDWDSVRRGPPHAIDAWGLGKWLQEAVLLVAPGACHYSGFLYSRGYRKPGAVYPLK